MVEINDGIQSRKILLWIKLIFHVQNPAGYKKSPADRRRGEWLQENVKAGNPQFLKGERIGLQNIGVSFSESHRLQKIASIPKEKFEDILTDSAHL